MQYGMPTLIENQSLAENISLCKELGLKFIELNMNFPEYQINQLENWENSIIWQRKAEFITRFIWMKILISQTLIHWSGKPI